MLTHLSIQNIVLIAAQDLEFGKGLCVLTGETGAGKSILLDALGLVLGERANASLVRHGEKGGEVTAEFDLSNNPRAKEILEELALDVEDTLLLRRTLGADGKSRCFANDHSVSVSALKQLGEALVEIYGQHDQRGLMDGSTHRDLLDAFGRHDALLKDVGEAWKQLRTLRDKLAACQQEAEQTRREEEYLRHMATELEKLAPEEGEEERLGEERTLMMQSEKLYELLNESIGALNGEASPASTLRGVQRALLRSALNDGKRFNAVVDALEKAATEAEMALDTLEEIGNSAAYEPEQLEQVEERLFALKGAARKYQLTCDELPGLLEEVQRKLKLISANDTAIRELEKEIKQARGAFEAAAGNLTKARREAAEALALAVQDELEPLKMGGTRFRVALQPLPEEQWSGKGMEAIVFEAATNVGKKHAESIPYAPISKIASGGELSRFMLAFKVALSNVRTPATMIFDEIDTGTGGAVADAIGKRLARLGKSAQVLVVTHLPQVAARGSQHWQVAKQEKKGEVTTCVKALGEKEKLEELARMLAGSKITAEARKAAGKLLEQAV